MNKIQTNIINFSKVGELFSCLNNNKNYGLIVDKHGIVYPDIKKCPTCRYNLIKNGYNRGLKQKSLKFDISLKKGKLKCSNKLCNHNLSLDKEIFDFWNKSNSLQIDNTIIDLKLRKLSSANIAKHITMQGRLHASRMQAILRI